METVKIVWNRAQKGSKPLGFCVYEVNVSASPESPGHIMNLILSVTRNKSSKNECTIVWGAQGFKKD